MKDTIHIALGFDNNYAMPCGVTIISICENTDSHIHLHAITANDVTDDVKAQIEGIVNKYGQQITYYEINEDAFSQLPSRLHISRSTYNRFMIPELLDNSITKALYLDTDLVAVQDITPLWSTPLEEHEPAAMAIDSHCSGVKEHNAIEIPLSQPYYNAGVLLMNLDCWRKEDISNKCIDSIVRNNYPWMDQDAMNAVIGNRVKKLHVRYNLQTPFITQPDDSWEIEKGLYFQEVYEGRSNPVILHYSEAIKPWHQLSLEFKEWHHYKSLSPWGNEPQRKFRKFNCHIWQMSEAADVDCEELEKNAPAYFIVFQKTVHRHPLLYKFISKSLWLLTKLLK